MKRRQSGMITPSNTAIAFSLAVIILAGVKIGPLYVEQMYVEGALKFLIENNSDLANMEKQELRSSLNRYMTINTLGDVQSKSFSVKRVKGQLYVSSVYEVRVSIIGNVEAVVSFKSQLNTAEPDTCCEYLVDVVDDKK